MLTEEQINNLRELRNRIESAPNLVRHYYNEEVDGKTCHCVLGHAFEMCNIQIPSHRNSSGIGRIIDYHFGNEADEIFLSKFGLEYYAWTIIQNTNDNTPLDDKFVDKEAFLEKFDLILSDYGIKLN